ncbi:MAG: M16 family metallopeptidase, partial [Planctomycetota bacterium]
LDELRRVKEEKGPLTAGVEVPTITPKAMVHLGWRGARLEDRDDSARLLFASRLLSSRLHRVVREERGLTYSLACAAQPSIEYPAMGKFLCQFTADPAKVEEAAALARKLIEGVFGEPPTDAEMETVHRQLANDVAARMLTPEFWAQTLSDLDSRGQTIEHMKRLKEHYAAIGRKDLLETLKRYLVDERYFQVIGTPRKR